MELSNKILSDLTVFSKYAKYDETKGRRETYEEIVNRLENMYINRYPELKDTINSAFKYVYDKKVVPSMRSFQFGGQAIEKNNMRLYNCSFQHIKRVKDFSDILFNLMSGTGVGYSVQKRHVDRLPEVKLPKRSKKYLISDDIPGWCDAVKALISAYLKGSSLPLFDYSEIRPKGAPLKTSGGKAPGPEPLRRALNKIESLLSSKEVGTKLAPIDVHDIVCHLADATLSGGIRRSAAIVLFDRDDMDMLTCKSNFKVDVLNGGFHLNPQTNCYDGAVTYKGKTYNISLYGDEQFQEFNVSKSLPWWNFEPQRGRANNSVVLKHGEVDKDYFLHLWKIIQDSGCGEPGFFWTNDYDLGVNPCVEISLNTNQVCNLTEINFSTIESQPDFNQRAWAATIIGTLQASFTDFYYVNSDWIDITKKEALLGVSMTGIADRPDLLPILNWKETTDLILKTNEEFSKVLGINPAARISCTKPSGSTSCVLGTASGIHARHSKYYIRRIRYNKQESIAQYLQMFHPEMIEDEMGNDLNIVVSIPQKSPDTSITREDEHPLDLLERVKFIHTNWIKPTHRTGQNTHNVSCTVSIKDNEWNDVGEWMWENRESYTGLSVLPFDGGSYVQAPFEEIDEETYNNMMKNLKELDITQVKEDGDYTDLQGELACSGGQCEVNF